ncbi:hydrolase [Planctomicrobium sp. SH664]|uniref:hydrolase n=1 Tax=Planctomicrobium sp. SH664 TaxID=3448125 RepID=UPI003F5C53FD
MTATDFSRSPELLSAASSRLLILDMQERLLPVMTGLDRMIDRCVKLVQGSQLFEIPVSATEQYPKGLGPTVPPLAGLIPHRPEKLRFSAVEALDWSGEGKSAGARHQIVIAGIETHVCVLQTAFDLLARGFDVYVVADATGSRNPTDHELGLKRLADGGVRLVTSEMVLMEWCEVAGSERFKAISRLVK